MRTGMPLSRSLNQKGMSIVSVLMVLTVVSISAVTVFTIGNQKRKVSQQMNIVASANLVKQRLVGLIMAPQSWQTTQAHNSSAFAYPGANSAPLPLNVYMPGASTPYYAGSNQEAGFDLQGNPCLGFRTSGNDSCPFRYEITVQSRVFQNGNWIDTLHFDLSFRPSSPELVLNDKSPNFTFNLVRNLNDQSVESACISINGVYSADTNSCSVSITRTVAACSGNQTYRGPASNAGSTNCDTKSIAVTACAPPQVVKGFNMNGNPICGAAL